MSLERDPVCGMSVDPNQAAAKVEHGGKTYYFCAPGCAKRFQQAPEKYLQPDLQSANNVSERPGLVNLNAGPQSTGAAAAALATKQEKYKASHATVPEADHRATTQN